MTREADLFAMISKPCPVPEGTRIRLLFMADDPDPIPVGSTGTVVGGNGGQLWMKWDDGRSLNLDLSVDRYEVLESEEKT